MTDTTLANDMGTDPAGETASQAQAAKTFTQDEVNAILARTKSQLEKKYASKYEDLGDPDELRSIKTDWEKKQQEQQIKRGEFEKTLQEMAAKKDAEIQKRDSVIKEYKVNVPILSAAAKFNAVNAEQVKSLLAQNVRLNSEGEVEVVDEKGSVRYNDRGEPVAVEELVRGFLDSNPHFKMASPSTTNTRTNISSGSAEKLDVSKLNMTNPEHRKIYSQHRKSLGLA
jgi:hypothetical protein